MGKCAEFIRGAAELARSVRFRQGIRTRLRDDRLSHSRIQADTDWEAPLSGTHVWDKVILVGNRETFCRDPGCFSGLGVRTMAGTAMDGSHGSSIPNYRDLPVSVSLWAQMETGRAATDPHQGAPPDGRCGTDLGPRNGLRDPAARWMTRDDEVIWEQGSRAAVRKSDD